MSAPLPEVVAQIRLPEKLYDVFSGSARFPRRPESNFLIPSIHHRKRIREFPLSRG